MHTRQRVIVSGCRKRGHATELDALLALSAIDRGANCEKEEQRVYECERCGDWHLTSWAPERQPGNTVH